MITPAQKMGEWDKRTVYDFYPMCEVVFFNSSKLKMYIVNSRATSEKQNSTKKEI